MSHFTAERRLRADAARNRQLILDTARTLFATRGIGVTLNDIAAEAGVGVGTVYRRFPDKSAVLDELAASKFVSLIELTEHAAAVRDPREALQGFLRSIFELRLRDRSLHQTLSILGADGEKFADYWDRLRSGTEALFRRARQEAVLREGFDAADLPAIVEMFGVVVDQIETGSPNWRRWADLVVEGLTH